MNTITSWQGALITSWAEVWSSTLLIIPRFLGAVLVFIVGLILAYWARRFIVEVLKVLKVEKLSQKAGIENFLAKADIKLDLVQLVGTFFEWIVIYVFFLTFVDILGLTSVSRVLTVVLGYIPNILAAALIFAAGYFVANLVDGLVRSALATVDHEAAKPVGKIARWLVIVISLFAAIDQLQIAQGLINTFFQGLSYTIVLVVGLSVGLGAKDLVARILNDWYDKIKK